VADTKLPAPWYDPGNLGKNLGGFNARSMQVKTVLTAGLQCINAMDEPVEAQQLVEEAGAIANALLLLTNSVFNVEDVSQIVWTAAAEEKARVSIPLLDKIQDQTLAWAKKVGTVSGCTPAGADSKVTPDTGWNLFSLFGGSIVGTLLGVGLGYLGVRYIAYPMWQDWRAKKRLGGGG
jgi:hypothetical protein